MKTAFFFALVFIFGALIGFLKYHSTIDLIMPVFEEMKNQIFNPGSPLETAYNIFMNNLTVSLILYLTGVSLILPLLVVGSNGFILGFFTRHSLEHEDVGLWFLFKGLIAHSIFELPALFIAAAIGYRMGVVFFSMILEVLICLITQKNQINLQEHKKKFIKQVKEGYFVYITVVVPLLLFAALIETYVTAWLLGIY